MSVHVRILDLSEIIEGYSPGDPPVDRLRSGQSLIQAAIAILAEVARETKDRHAEAYVVDHLRIIVSSDHEFIDRSYNLDQWIEQLEDGGDDEVKP